MRALVSVSDKSGIVDFCLELNKRNIEIVATGNTFDVLERNGVNVVSVKDLTGFPEIFDGRVKTLHPNIHGGILYKRDNYNHVATLEKLNIKPINLVVVNLYPFEHNIDKKLNDDKMVELIDIGGPAMLRSAAKNFKDILVVCDPSDYNSVLEHLDEPKEDFNKLLAMKAFNLTAHYDTVISNYFLEEQKDYFNITSEVKDVLRYGENPHQKAIYTQFPEAIGFNDIEILNGKALSYNNYLDVNSAFQLLNDFSSNVIFSLKHSNPCAVASGTDLLKMYEEVYQGDSISIFGGIVATNMKIDFKTAKKLNETFLEIIIAPDFSEEALKELKKKKNLRLIKYGNLSNGEFEYRSVMGGLLVQTPDVTSSKNLDFENVSEHKSTFTKKTIILANTTVKHVKSNAIVVAKNNAVIGVGAGQMNRIQSAEIALKDKGDEPLLLASDAFFPFADIVELASKYNVQTIVQPGGSINDQKVIDKCNELGIALIFTHTRTFKH